MKILIIDNGTKHLGKLKELLFKNEIIVSNFLSKYPPDSKYDLIVLSGGGQVSISSSPEVFSEEIKLIKTSLKPIIGICEGCEMIAYTYGSVLEFQNRKSIGFKTITPIKNDPLFEGFKNMKVYEAHHWAITKLGKDLVGLAKSRTGYEIIKHKNKKIYGLQFHPEMFKDKAIGDELFIRVFTRVKGEVVPGIQ